MRAWEEIKKAAAPYSRSFNEALSNCRRTQETVLLNIVQANKHSEFGTLYGFSEIHSAKMFQSRVPVQCYEDIQRFIERMANGESDILVSEPVEFFEQTSSTSDVAKLIPYTKSTLEDFRLALFPWIFELTESLPSIREGSAYWSISPAGREAKTTRGGLSIGIGNDALYFGRELAQYISSTLAVPHWVGQIQSLSTWQYVSLRYLLADAELCLFSIWSPTFLLQLMDALAENIDLLLEDIKTGSVSVDGLEEFKQHINFRPVPDRALVVASAFKGPHVDTKQLWPNLQLISCWASASSALYADELQAVFPEVKLQAKGLLATEGAITVPILDAGQTVLAIRSGFYEFLAEDNSVYLADELQTGQAYSVLLTNNCGLYRYAIGDRVRVVGWHYSTPCLEFVGRSGVVSDLCGEKFNEAFVVPLLKNYLGFSLLVPQLQPRPKYILYVDAVKISISRAKEIEVELEQALRKNIQYEYAVRLGQLDPVSVVRADAPYESYKNYFLDNNVKLGDIKMLGLSQSAHWHSCFNCSKG